jgi:vacuolar-type H+-ATPase subunit E/Vma4
MSESDLQMKLQVVIQAAKMGIPKAADPATAGRLTIIAETAEMAKKRAFEMEAQLNATQRVLEETERRLQERNSEVKRLQDELFGWRRDRELLVRKVRKLQGKPAFHVDCDCGPVNCGCIDDAYRRAIEEEE